MRHLMRVLISLITAVVLVTGICASVSAATLDEAKKKDQELKAKKKQTEADVADLSNKLTALIDEMAKTEKKLAAKQKEIDAAEEKLVEAKVRENEQYNDMKLRIRYMYEEGDTAVLTVLLESHSIADLLQRVEYANEISGYDRHMLEEFQAITREVESQERKLQDEYQKLGVLQDQLSTQKDEVQQLLDDKQVQLNDLDKQIGDNAKELQRLIAEAEAARKAQQEAAAAKKAAAGNATYGTPGKPRITGKGQFTHPCPGSYLSSGFGYRSFDHSFHKGYDFASHGKSLPTYAAAAGTVIIAGWSGSAGNWVVINHGNGLVTKYMHHLKLYVHAGQKVSKGQNIGMSGTTGYSSGIHLHFQVEVDGVAVDPGPYL